jgi:hypothetical protein
MVDAPDDLLPIILEYETSLAEALGTLKGADKLTRIKACVRFANAVAVVRDMKPDVYQAFGKQLLARNRVRPGSPMEVLAAMQRDWDEDNQAKPNDQYNLF